MSAMIIILKNNIKEKLNLIENKKLYKLTEEQEKDLHITFIAYVRLYVTKVGKDEFLKTILSNSSYSFLLEK